ncbi:MAG: hypothetical protein WCW14_02580 [Candidatus Paceibacterota bacterium]|jgi:hypothetical protein
MENPIPNNFQPPKKDIKSLMLFASDPHTAYLFKKTEKLASALYLITGLLSDNEPMKWSMRDIGLKLLSHGVSLSRMSLKDRKERSYDLLATLLESISLLEIAHTAQLLSRMNYELIKSETDKVIQSIESHEHNLVSPHLVLPNDFFSGSDLEGSFRRPLVERNFDKGQKDSHTDMSHIKQGGVLNKMSLIQKDKNTRQQKIVDLLKDGVSLTVKDFAKVINDCSEKTIQRELLSLVSLGTLRKEGERRWSRYSLKDK